MGGVSWGARSPPAHAQSKKPGFRANHRIGSTVQIHIGF